MNGFVNGTLVGITLSRANLVALLSKLDEPSSMRTIVRTLPNGLHLMVQAETDDAHYKDRERGPMSPDAENAITLHKEGKLAFLPGQKKGEQ